MTMVSPPWPCLLPSRPIVYALLVVVPPGTHDLLTAEEFKLRRKINLSRLGHQHPHEPNLVALWELEMHRDLLNDWPASREVASAREVPSLTGKVWSVTFVLRAGKYFVWQLLILTRCFVKGNR